MLKALRSLPIVCLLLSSFVFASQPSVPATDGLLTFEPNRGQTAPQVRYLARSREGVLFFTPDGVTVAVPHQGSFRLLFDNAAAKKEAINPEQELIARSNYLNRQPAIVGVENYAALRYASVYPGIDVRFYGQGRHLEHDFLLAPGTDVSRIVLRTEGIDQIHLQPAGDAELTLGSMKLIESAPRAWQTIKGKRVAVQAAWKLIGSDRLGISLGTYDRDLPVTIDPVLAYATHLGGTTGQDLSLETSFPADTFITALGLDGNGNIYVGGTTNAVDYPTTAGAFDRSANTRAIFHDDTTTQSGFVSKFDKTGRILIYSTFLRVAVEAMSVDSAGIVYSAEAQEDEFPGPNPGFDIGIHIDKLSADGSKLLYTNMFAQGSDATSPACQTFTSSTVGSLIADNSGHVYLAGNTTNPCIATPGAFQTTLPNSNTTGYVAKFNTNVAPASSLVFSTYLGGSDGIDEVNAIAIDSSANMYVAGTTSSATFPHGATFGSGTPRAFVSKLNPSASGLIFSTLLGGADGFRGVTGIGLDPSHNVYITGTTSESGYPTTAGAFQTTIAGGSDAFVTKLSTGGGSLIFSTFLGGSGTDGSSGLHLNSAQMVFLTGTTSSANFPTTANAFRRTLAPATQDAFVTALQPDGKSLYYSTLLGGSNTSSGAAIWVDAAWNAWIGGNTSAPDFPVTPDAFQPGLKGNSDGFIAKVVIAADLALLSPTAPATIHQGQTLTYSLLIGNQGPDNSDNLVITDTLASGTSIVSSSLSGGTGPTSCTTPSPTQNGGTITCNWRGLPAHETIAVTIKVKVNAAAGTRLVNNFNVKAQTQDLVPSNNSVSFTTQVQ
ncbi:MAG TPA: SBBP repeat-containing protein [Candidatus Angelobacter sp.]